MCRQDSKTHFLKQPLKCVVFLKTTGGKGKPGGGTIGLKMQSRRSGLALRHIKLWLKQATKPRQQRLRLPTMRPSGQQNMQFGRQFSQKAEKEQFAYISPNDSSIFKLAKQMDRTNLDVVGEKCVRNDAGELSLNDEDKMKAWVEHYARLLNVEFEWPSDLLPKVDPVEGPPPPVTMDIIRKALSKMKCGKAAGPSGIIAEMLKAAGEEGIDMLRKLAEVVFSSGVIPKDWQESYILNLYKGKGGALDQGNYRGLKITDQVMKLLERVLDSFIRGMVDIDSMQFGFVPG
ncbi:uncharacterized protein LOC128547046 [Mercenaria mercenaria]|uniref:uncharacterized protein LOC128547046 n=1 Tax=Mercenaria mercenaria TaxID=6596 RepID=UPI00234E422D|nr:uncharacterized protein LOC128547046 [Mercenaria mercenaria]